MSQSDPEQKIVVVGAGPGADSDELVNRINRVSPGQLLAVAAAIGEPYAEFWPMPRIPEPKQRPVVTSADQAALEKAALKRERKQLRNLGKKG